MNTFAFLASLAIAAVLACAVARAADVNTVPEDQTVTINGIDIACTGVGDEARSDPRWRDYPVRIEFAGGEAQYLSDLDITIFDAKGESILEVRCNSPWLLAALPPGKYTVRGTFEHLTKTAKFTAPSSGQARVIVRFPEIVGND